MKKLSKRLIAFALLSALLFANTSSLAAADEQAGQESTSNDVVGEAAVNSNENVPAQEPTNPQNDNQQLNNNQDGGDSNANPESAGDANGTGLDSQGANNSQNSNDNSDQTNLDKPTNSTNTDGLSDTDTPDNSSDDADDDDANGADSDDDSDDSDSKDDADDKDDDDDEDDDDDDDEEEEEEEEEGTFYYLRENDLYEVIRTKELVDEENGTYEPREVNHSYKVIKDMKMEESKLSSNAASGADGSANQSAQDDSDVPDEAVQFTIELNPEVVTKAGGIAKVQLLTYKITGAGFATIEAVDAKKTGDATYVCTLRQKGVEYKTIGPIAVFNELSSIDKKHREKMVAVKDIKKNFTIADENLNIDFESTVYSVPSGWTYNKEDEESIWYSSKVHGSDEILVFDARARSHIQKPINPKVYDTETGEQLQKLSDLDDEITSEFSSDYAGNWHDVLGSDIYKGIKASASWFLDYRPQYNKEINTKYTFVVPADDDGEHEYVLEYLRYWGDSKQKKYFKTYIDNTAPVLELTYNNVNSPKGSDGADEGYYREDVEVVAKVTEKHMSEENRHLHDIVIYGKTDGSKTYFRKTDKEKTENGTVYTYKATVSADGIYQVKGLTKEGAIIDNVAVHDLAGNPSADNTQKEFTIDHNAPKVEITFDNNEAQNEKYYKADRTATITVTDENFGIDDKYLLMNLSEKDGKAESSSWENAGSGKYVKKITFNQEGTYSFNFSCKDKAGNESEKKSIAEFVIDKKAPEFDVTFDNNTAKNEIYYNSARKATIKVKDYSFSDSLVSIGKSGEADSLPAVSTFAENGTEHTAIVTFESDGKYGFTINCKDLAGNEAETYTSSVFIIDTQKPQIDITGVANQSANNGVVEPVVTTTDKNIKPEDVEISVIASNGGNYPVTFDQNVSGEKITYHLKDIPHEQKNDDLYTLKVKSTDMAGNDVDSEIKYAVNRFGSIYVVDDATIKMVDGKYVTQPKDVVIKEINVSPLMSKNVSLRYNENSVSGANYAVDDQVNTKGWHEITYTVKASNFNKDGFYTVIVNSQDAAANKQSNQSKGAEIGFIVDSTAPSVVVAGIEDGERYTEESHDFSVNATDTIGLKDLTVLIDGEKQVELDGEELLASGGTQVLTLEGKDEVQNVVIESHDVAGNETKLAYNVVVSLKAEEVEIDPATPPVIAKVVKDHKTAFIVGGVAAVGAGGAGIVLRRRKLKLK